MDFPPWNKQIFLIKAEINKPVQVNQRQKRADVGLRHFVEEELYLGCNFPASCTECVVSRLHTLVSHLDELSSSPRLS